MKHAFLDVPDTSPTFYALCAVLLLELLALGPLENYVNKPESLPPTVVPCRHVRLANCSDIIAIGAWTGEPVTNYSNVIWIGATNQP